MATSFYEQETIRNLRYGSAMEAYIHAIPYMFYTVVAVIIVPLVVMGMVPLIGTMKEEYKKLRLDRVHRKKRSSLKTI